MQRHQYSMTAFFPSVLFLGGIAIYTVIYGLPPYYIFLIGAAICYALYRIIDIHRNSYYRRMHRATMRDHLIVLPNFRADETHLSEYNGYILQIDHMRGLVGLVDHNLETHRLRADDIVACYYKADVQKQLKSNGTELVRAEDTYEQLSLIIETKIPDKERLSYVCFNAWHCTGHIKRTVKASDKRLIQALEEVKLAVERIQAMKE